MKTISIILTLMILIGCGQKKQDRSQKKDRTEIISEPEKDTQLQTNNSQIRIEPGEKTKCNVDGLVDWQKDVAVKLFDQPNGKIIDTLTHDIQGEDYLTFTIFDSKGEFLKVKIGRAIERQQKTGWIRKGKYIGTYARNYSDSDTLFLYTKPDKQSLPTDTINEYFTELYQIVACDGQWAKVTMKTRDKEFTGWIEPEMQCSSPYTTCN